MIDARVGAASGYDDRMIEHREQSEKSGQDRWAARQSVKNAK
jgi:hypothetical protein